MLGLESLEGEFVIRDNDQITRYTRAKDLPDTFDHLIEFAPRTPEPQQTETDHVERSNYADNLQE